jgi:phosphatidylserine decarboxylase
VPLWYILFGSRVEVYLPANSRVDVQAGDRVTAGAGVLATLIHK